MDAVGCAVLAPLVALATHGLPRQGLEGSFLLGTDVLVVEATGTALVSLQALFHDVGVVHRDDRLLTGVAAIASQDVVGSRAAADAVLVAWLALSLVVVLGKRTLLHTEGSVAHVAADAAVAGSWTETLAQAFLVTLFADLITSIVDPVAARVCDSRMEGSVCVCMFEFVRMVFVRIPRSVARDMEQGCR